MFTCHCSEPLLKRVVLVGCMWELFQLQYWGCCKALCVLCNSGVMSCCCSPTALMCSEVTRTFKVRVRSPAWIVACPARSDGPDGARRVLFLPLFGCPVLNSVPLAAQELLEALQLLPELRWRAGSLIKRRLLGSGESCVVMALVLRWFQQRCLEAWGFYCLLYLNSWNLWTYFRVAAPSPLCHLRVSAAVALIWGTTWIT